MLSSEPAPNGSILMLRQRQQNQPCHRHSNWKQPIRKSSFAVTERAVDKSLCSLSCLKGKRKKKEAVKITSVIIKIVDFNEPLWTPTSHISRENLN